MKQLLSIALVLSSFLTYSQINFKTGDASLEAELNLVNKEALVDLATFKKNLSTDFGVAVEKVENLLKSMIPAEALLAIKIATITKQPIEKVAESYKANKDKGWGAIAKEMGIKPGSPEFHALKGNKSKGNGKSKGKGKP